MDPNLDNYSCRNPNYFGCKPPETGRSDMMGSLLCMSEARLVGLGVNRNIYIYIYIYVYEHENYEPYYSD